MQSMYMSVIAREAGTETYPELAGARVVVTGLSTVRGVDLARAFADRKASLCLQTDERTPEMIELVALLAITAGDVKLTDLGFSRSCTPTRFAQRAAEDLGGLDAVFNLASVTHAEMAAVATMEEIEDLIVAKLGPLREITEVAANRMALTWSEGTILNAVVAPAPQTDRDAAILGMVRQALAAMTADLARRWSGDVVRINAIGPKATTLDSMSGACLTSEPDIAALALYLASRKGRTLTGHVFDAEGVSRRGC
jgi:3-oxoacyl-[acyl-carrier protein] reductase